MTPAASTALEDRLRAVETYVAVARERRANEHQEVEETRTGLNAVVARIDRLERLMLVCAAVLFTSTSTGAQLIEKVAQVFH